MILLGSWGPTILVIAKPELPARNFTLGNQSQAAKVFTGLVGDKGSIDILYGDSRRIISPNSSSIPTQGKMKMTVQQTRECFTTSLAQDSPEKMLY